MNALVLAALVSAGVLAASGCARSAEERQLDAMRDDIDRLQRDRDQADRPLGAASSPEALSPRTAPGVEAPSASAGELGPIRVGAGWNDEPVADDYADPEDTAPRPRIRVIGGRASFGRGLTEPQATVEEAVDPGDPAHASFDPQAKPAYDEAVALVTAKHYDGALDALAAFLVKWPDHPLAGHAMYWRGECYYARGETQRALEQFEGLLARFPAGAKAPDALLKAGLCHQRLGHAAEARASFERLVREFPQSDAAHRAPEGSTFAGPSASRSEDR